jgi:hypothetical protein
VRLNGEQVRETEAYTLGVQAVLWGMQWVKAGQAFRMFAHPVPEDAPRSPACLVMRHVPRLPRCCNLR